MGSCSMRMMRDESIRCEGAHILLYLRRRRIVRQLKDLVVIDKLCFGSSKPGSRVEE